MLSGVAIMKFCKLLKVKANEMFCLIFYEHSWKTCLADHMGPQLEKKIRGLYIHHILLYKYVNENNIINGLDVDGSRFNDIVLNIMKSKM